MTYELTFWGGIKCKYKRVHETLASAEAEAKRILEKLPNRAAHPAVIYDDNKAVKSVQ